MYFANYYYVNFFPGNIARSVTGVDVSNRAEMIVDSPEEKPIKKLGLNFLRFTSDHCVVAASANYAYRYG